MFVRIYGCSDDLIEIEGNISDEFYAAHMNNGLDGKTLIIAGDPGNALEIKVVYHDDGEWRITYEPIWDSPRWVVAKTYGQDCEYSETLLIETQNERIRLIA